MKYKMHCIKTNKVIALQVADNLYQPMYLNNKLFTT